MKCSLVLWALTVAATAAIVQAETVEAPESELPGIRDPFWPVGWTPPSPEEEVKAPPEATPVAPLPAKRAPAKWDQAERQLRIKGISKLPSGKYVAVVAHVGVVEEGDVLSVKYEGQVYRWKVESVTPSGLVPKRLGIVAATGNDSETGP